MDIFCYSSLVVGVVFIFFLIFILLFLSFSIFMVVILNFLFSFSWVASLGIMVILPLVINSFNIIGYTVGLSQRLESISLKLWGLDPIESYELCSNGFSNSVKSEVGWHW